MPGFRAGSAPRQYTEAMPRRIIKKYLPDSVKLRNHPHLQRFGHRLHDPNLWHLNRRSISGAVAVGLFCALLPLPGQMIVAALLAIWTRVNLPASVLLIWVTNPVTIPPVFYSTYLFGAWMLGEPPMQVKFDLSLGTLSTLGRIWQPLFLGSIVTGLLAAFLGYFTVRLLWRFYVVRRCRRRRQPQQL